MAYHPPWQGQLHYIRSFYPTWPAINLCHPPWQGQLHYIRFFYPTWLPLICAILIGRDSYITLGLSIQHDLASVYAILLVRDSYITSSHSIKHDLPSSFSGIATLHKVFLSNMTCHPHMYGWDSYITSGLSIHLPAIFFLRDSYITYGLSIQHDMSSSLY